MVRGVFQLGVLAVLAAIIGCALFLLLSGHINRHLTTIFYLTFLETVLHSSYSSLSRY